MNNIDTLLDSIRQHAITHYEEDGWDILVECWSDDDILEVIGDSTNFEEAIITLSDTLSTINEYRQEIQNA